MAGGDCAAPRAAFRADRPGHVPAPRRTDQVGVFVAPEASRLTALAEITGRTKRDLMSEAITRLAVAHDQPIEPELRQRFRRIVLGLE
jgi:hypothetical protein